MAYLIPGQQREPLPPAYSLSALPPTPTNPTDSATSETHTTTTTTITSSPPSVPLDSQPPPPIHARFIDIPDHDLDTDPELAAPPPAYTPSRPARVRAMFVSNPHRYAMADAHTRMNVTMDMYKTRKQRRRWYAIGAALAMIIVLAVVAGQLSGSLGNNSN